MSDEDGRAPEPEDEDKAVLVRDEEGGLRLVPGGNIVEGEMVEEEDSPRPARDL